MTVREDAQSQREEDLVDRVVASFEESTDSRLAEVMRSLTRHLHAFVRDVRLTESEWERAVAFLAEAGRITTADRQEIVLLSDVLGLSMQIVTMNNPAERNATEATVFGPFFVDDAPLIQSGDDMSFGATGEPCWVSGRVTDTHGDALEGARIEVWEADDDGFYDVQYGDGRRAARAHLFSDANGEYRFWGLTPTPYPIPHDGPVGELLAATGRSPLRASHLHFMVSAPGHRRLITHIFVRDDEIGERDAVFGVRESLVKDFVRHDASEPTPDGRLLEGSWTDVRFDIVLATA